MGATQDVKRGSKRSSKNQRVRKQSKQAKPKSKSTTRPSDVYEAEENDPQEEVKAGQRYDRVDNYEYELPSDFEDEEIDEEGAFTEADKKQFADWFGDDAAADGTALSEDASEHDLLNSESEQSDEEELNPDDYSEDEFEQLQSTRRKSASAIGARIHRKSPSSQAPAADAMADSAPESSSEGVGQEEEEEEDQGSEEGDSDEEEDEKIAAGDEDARHQAMLAEVRGAVSDRKRKRTAIATEAYPDSEYNLPPTSGPAGELSIADLMKGLGDAKSKLGPARKALMKMAKQAEPLATPLPGPIRERQERKAGYETTKEDITKWQPLVKANREAPTLEFKSNKDEIVRSSTTAALAAKFTPDNDMEEEVADLLRAAGAHTGEAVEEAEEALALKALTVEEAKERRERMAKMRSLLFAHEQKAKRLKAIKSKGFHRHAKKAAKMKALKAGETGDEDIIRLAAEDAELARAKERLTLKHRNSSKWARRALKRGMDVMDEGTKAAVAEQLRLGEELRRKVDRIDDKSGSEQSDSDDSTSASDEEADDTQAPARKRAASNKARAAALDILQGSTEEGPEGAQPKTGLFSLPFMTKAAERQRLNAQQEAAAVLAQLEAEDAEAAAGSDADVGAAEPHGWESGSGNAGRMSFGTTPATQRQQRVSEDEAASSSGGEEDAEAKAARLGMRIADGGAAATRLSSRAQGISATASKRKRKRARDAGAAANEEDTRDNRMASSSGPVAVDQGDADAGSAVPGSTSSVHARAFGHSNWGPSATTAPNRMRNQAAAASQPASVHIGPLSAADARTDRQSQQADQSLPAFVKAKAFSGAKPGYAFKKGSKGVGYYSEAGASDLAISKSQQQKQSDMLPGKSNVSKGQRRQQQQHQQQAGEEEEAGAMSDEDMQPVKGPELSQAELIKRAFAGDDVQADFEAAKAAEVEEELPKQDEISVLPGWGSWAGQQKEPHWMKAANQKAQRQKEAAAASRKDSKLKAVVISEAWDKKSSKYNSPSLPFPFDCKTTYEQSMRTPMGREFNTTAAHRDMTRPAVIKHSGMIIDPIKFNKAAADTAKQAKAKSRKMKVSVSAGIPRPSRR